MIGSNLKSVANDFIDDILMPFVHPILIFFSNQSGKGMRFKIPGTNITLKLKRVVSALIKFICLTFIIFFLLSLGVKLKKPTQWVSVRNFNEMKNFIK